jgi:stearoyl-CoA desaturase (delta-9 desaturase)
MTSTVSRRSLAATGFQLVCRTGPLVAIHLGALAAVFTTPVLVDWVVFAVALYGRGLITTIGYHRYFAHRSFKTSRAGQFVLACLCCCNAQNGPLWWAAHHRRHHKHSDTPDDVHSPVQGGFFWAHMGWLFATLEAPGRDTVRDLRRFPELRYLERVWMLPPLVAAVAFWLVGGWSLLCVGFCLSAVVTFHMSFAVNSVAHLIGSRRYDTPDTSRNSLVLAVLTLGEGWHNNHHHYPHTAQAGFFWWEIDASFRLIRVLEAVGLVWAVRRVPPHKLGPTVPSATPAAEPVGVA